MYKRIKELRKNNNLKMSEIANLLEISVELYSLYENGKREISISKLSKLAKFYNTSIDYIVGDTDEISPHKWLFKSQSINFSCISNYYEWIAV